MLGTFSIEPWFKSYCMFTIWSLEVLEIAKQPFSSTSSSFPCFSRRRCAEPVAGAVESLPGRVLLRAGAHASPRSLSTALAIALCLPLPCHAPPPSAEPPARPPPRCRRGEPAAELAALPYRAHGHYKNPSILFLSSFCLHRAPTPQNAAAAPLERRRAHPRRGAAM